MPTGIKWDFAKWQAGMQRLAAGFTTATGQCAAGVGMRVLEDCVNIAPTVPIRTGTLRASGTYEVIQRGLGWREVEIIVGYNTAYAARVHQVPMNFNRALDPAVGNYFLSSKLDRFGKQYVELWGQCVGQRLGMR